MNDDLVFEYSMTSYLNSTFLHYNCNQTRSAVFDKVVNNVCPSNGIVTPGMPTIILSDSAGEIFSFDSSEYFIYPTHRDNTEAIKGSLGVQLFVDTNSTVSFGRLFVQKYGLRIEYQQQIEDIYLAVIYTKYNLPQSDSAILLLLAWFLIFTFLIMILYKIFKMKNKRLEREDTIFYQIYNNMKEQDPDTVNNQENDILK